MPALTWADAGRPGYLSAGTTGEQNWLFGLSAEGQAVFRIPLPARGHAAAAHPHRPEAVAFARRPGTFAVVLDCLTGQAVAELNSPIGRHFYGHGVFSADGTILLTTENDYENAKGVISLWDASRGYRRVGEIPSHGVGPHDIQRLPETDTFAVANGGIETHPDHGREKLNLPTMRPNLSYVSLDGDLLDQLELSADQHLSSIRHLAVAGDGTVAMGMQWQGEETPTRSLVGLHRMGEAYAPLAQDDLTQSRLQGYIGSITFDTTAHRVGVTSPRGGLLYVYDATTGARIDTIARLDICGVAAGPNGFVYTTGHGYFGNFQIPENARQHRVQWDNHLIRICNLAA